MASQTHFYNAYKSRSGFLLEAGSSISSDQPILSGPVISDSEIGFDAEYAVIVEKPVAAAFTWRNAEHQKKSKQLSQGGLLQL